MDPLALAVSLLAFALVVAVPVMALVALMRTRRLGELEQRVRELERELRALHRSGDLPVEPRPPLVEQLPHLRHEPAEPTAPAEPAQARTPAPPRRLPPPLPEPALEREREPQPARPPLAEPRPAASPAAVPRLTPRPRAPRIEWERWVGVRGAALASGVVIAIAGILFYRHAVEQGWVRPELRVATGALAGLVAIAGAELLARRAFRFVPAALAGAGTVLLYASLWAAHRLYDLLPVAATLPAMSAVTVLCGWLAVRHGAQAVAGIGILGGFATPLVLQTSDPSPIGLFGYVLLLDLGLLALARRMRWPLLALLGVLGTFGIELLWFERLLDASSLAITLVSLGLFGLLFAALAPARDERGVWPFTGAGSLLLPFLFVLHLATRADLGEELWPLALVAVVLQTGAAWSARRQTEAWLPGAAAAAGVALVAAWATRGALDPARAWELSASAVGLALPCALFALLRGEPARLESLRIGALVAAAGQLAMLCVAAGQNSGMEPAPLAAGLFAAALLLQAVRGPGWLRLARPLAGGGLGLGLALLVFRADPTRDPAATSMAAAAALLLGGAALLHALAWLDPTARTDEARRDAFHAAALFALPALGVLSSGELLRHADAPLALGTTLLLGLSTAAAASALGRGGWLVAAALATGFAQVIWMNGAVVDARLGEALTRERLPLALGLASTLCFIAWPIAFRSLRAKSSAWRAATVAPLVWFSGLKPLFDQQLAERWSFALPAILAAALTFAAVLQRRATDERARRVAAAWLGAGACLFAALAIALPLDHYEGRVLGALFGAGVLALWCRVDHLGLKLWGLFGLAVAAGGVLEGAADDGHYLSGTYVVWNWMSYAHLVPAAAFVAAALILAPREVARARPFEAPLYRLGKPWLAGLCGLCAALTIFVWINLSIFDLYGEAERIVVDLDRDERRDLTLSIAWVVYALVLLALGMARRSSGLRWLSLAFLVVSLGKVFLYDLGELEGLYRVFSLLGLGLSLLVVSLLYQRFVFPHGRGEDPDSERTPRAA